MRLYVSNVYFRPLIYGCCCCLLPVNTTSSSRKEGVLCTHPGNILLICVTRSEQIRGKRFAMLSSQQYIPCIMFMQIIAAIIENIIGNYISANILVEQSWSWTLSVSLGTGGHGFVVLCMLVWLAYTS